MVNEDAKTRVQEMIEKAKASIDNYDVGNRVVSTTAKIGKHSKNALSSLDSALDSTMDTRGLSQETKSNAKKAVYGAGATVLLYMAPAILLPGPNILWWGAGLAYTGKKLFDTVTKHKPGNKY